MMAKCFQEIPTSHADMVPLPPHQEISALAQNPLPVSSTLWAREGAA